MYLLTLPPSILLILPFFTILSSFMVAFRWSWEHQHGCKWCLHKACSSFLPSFHLILHSFLHYTLFLHGVFQVKWGTSAWSWVRAGWRTLTWRRRWIWCGMRCAPTCSVCRTSSALARPLSTPTLWSAASGTCGCLAACWTEWFLSLSRRMLVTCMLKTIKFTHKKQKKWECPPLTCPLQKKEERRCSYGIKTCRTKRVISWILASCQGHMVTLGRKSRLCEGNAHDLSKLLLLVHPFLCFL